MSLAENELLNTHAVDQLVILVEEATRATKDSPRRFIEPARGTLDRAKSRRHHIIFGRRGSGKTSLLRKASADLTLQRVPAAFIDLEAFKGHAYPDVLLSVLIETFNAFDNWLGTAGVNSSKKANFWNRIWGGTPVRPPLDKSKSDLVRTKLRSVISDLTLLLNSDDDVELVRSSGSTERAAQSSSVETGGGILFGARGSVAQTDGKLSRTKTVRSSDDSEQVIELKETSRRDKMGVLHRRIIDYQKLFDDIVDLSGSDAFIFLDDLYHLRRPDQAQVLDYFHRIVKGRSVWLKAGTIRHRTDWYRHGNPPTGLKLGDDCDDIDLDITLERYAVARRFLLQIIDQIIVEAGIASHQVILADGGVERLVLASGGVARDFLTIFRKAIDVARERGRTHRGERINAEDVNVAAGEHDKTKRDELRRDTFEEREALEAALLAVQTFCVDNKKNCFLVEQDTGDRSSEDLLGELVDLRFIHVAESRTTVREKPGKLYSAYMLDVSQYTGERLRRDIDMVSFWKRSELDLIRRSKYVLDLSQLS